MNDLISRQAAIDRLSHWYSDMLETNKEQEDLMEVIKAIPSAEPKTGHWITKDGKEQGYDIAGVKTWYIQIVCSECGFIKTAIEGHTGQYHYCPNCGAKMVEPQEQESEGAEC